MKIVLVGDLIIESGWCLGELQQLAEDHHAQFEAMDWETENVEGLRVRNLKIEKGGPAAVEPPGQLLKLVKTADVLLVHFCPVSADLIDAAPRLKLIGTLRTGMSNIDLEHAKKRGIPVVNLPGRLVEAVSDFTIGLILSIARGIVWSDGSLRRGTWGMGFESNETFIELSGKTVGLVGFGGIGRGVARKLAGFDVSLTACDPFVSGDVMADLGVRKAELPELFSTADIISIHTSLTESSRGMIGPEHIPLMKPRSYLVNTSRAEVIDKQALYDALKEKRIAGAALDVFWEEPIDIEDPFIKLDNVVLTPHIAGTMKESLLKSFSRLRERLEPRLKELAGGA